MRHFENGKFGLIHTPPERLKLVPHLLDYLPTAPALPVIADSTDYSLPLPNGLWGMLGNDQYGDCVEVALVNAICTQAQNAKVQVPQYTTDQVLAMYSAITGFKKSDPSTDNGTDPVDMLNWAQAQGLIVGWGQVPINDLGRLATAINLFGCVIAAVQVPENWMDSTTWDANGGPIEGGHAIVLPSYDRTGNCKVETWAELVKLTPAGRAQYGVAAYGIITKPWLGGNNQTIQGFDLADLQSALQAVA